MAYVTSDFQAFLIIENLSAFIQRLLIDFTEIEQVSNENSGYVVLQYDRGMYRDLLTVILASNLLQHTFEKLLNDARHNVAIARIDFYLVQEKFAADELRMFQERELAETNGNGVTRYMSTTHATMRECGQMIVTLRKVRLETYLAIVEHFKESLARVVR